MLLHKGAFCHAITQQLSTRRFLSHVFTVVLWILRNPSTSADFKDGQIAQRPRGLFLKSKDGCSPWKWSWARDCVCGEMQL